MSGSEMSVSMYQTKRHYIRVDGHIHIRLRETIKTHKVVGIEDKHKDISDMTIQRYFIFKHVFAAQLAQLKFTLDDVRKFYPSVRYEGLLWRVRSEDKSVKAMSR